MFRIIFVFFYYYGVFMLKKILIVDDDQVIHESLKLYLLREGFVIESAFDGEEGLKKFIETRPSLVILDMMMPKMNGNDLCREIRKLGNTPIIMLTAKSEEIDKIIGLELGADDYITKPFSSRELVARINSVLRRTGETSHTLSHQVNDEKDFVGNSDIYLDKNQSSVVMLGTPVYLTEKEFAILEFCMRHNNQIVTRESIFEYVWPNDTSGDLRMIDTHIKKIRQKIYIEQAKWVLNSVYRKGYKFEFLN